MKALLAMLGARVERDILVKHRRYVNHGLAPGRAFAVQARRRVTLVGTMVNQSSEAEARRRARANAEVRVFRAGEEEAMADADALYWDRIPVDERASFVWQLSLEVYALAHPGAAMNPDFLDLLRAFIDAEVRFLVVGAYALGVHGRPRATKDFDVWVEPSTANAPRVIRGLRAFGAFLAAPKAPSTA